MSLRPLRAALAALILAACATPQAAPPPGRAPSPRPPPEYRRPEPTPPPPQAARLLRLADLPGWAADDHAGALAAFRETCHVARDPGLAQICRQARATGPLDAQDSRGFFEANFRAEPSPPAGVLTAYFAPEYAARREASAEFSAPVRARPADPALLTADRAAIEASPADRALAWMRPEELFFLQIQGSGVLTFEDGARRKALYAANNGHPFVGIANPMRERGLLAGNNTSGDAIRRWLAEHRGPQADEIMRLNPRYAFFSLAADDGRQPAGAAGVPLPPGRAIAVDLRRHEVGELFWLDAEAPILTGAFPTYRRLVTALDTGGAIKGQVRADLYLGLGAAAGAEAGRVRHTLKMFKLVPVR